MGKGHINYVDVPHDLFDTDLYKLTMQQAVLKYFKDAKVEYRLYKRNYVGDAKLNSDKFIEQLKHEIREYAKHATFYKATLARVRKKMPFLKDSYLDFISDFKLNHKDVIIQKSNDVSNPPIIEVHGKWVDTILWEIPILFIISELYAKMFHKIKPYNSGGYNCIENKANALLWSGCNFADFGTRRRLGYYYHDRCVDKMKRKWEESGLLNGFMGTSNVMMAMYKYIPAVGTMAHEWIMGVAGKCDGGVAKADKVAMVLWEKLYEGQLGIALSDTYTVPLFLKNFTGRLSRLYDGVRHDSGDPKEFIDKMIMHYKRNNIDPMTKTIVFSDSITTLKALELNHICKLKGIKCMFGIGGHFTNDPTTDGFTLDTVVKLHKIDGVRVCKLSDIRGKATGDEAVIKKTWEEVSCALKP